MSKADLIKVYNTVVRPCAEYCSVVYNTLIPKYISEKLEGMQKRAYKIRHGNNINYEGKVNNKEIETLRERREKHSLQFALKNKDTLRFGHWFPREPMTRNVRESTHRKYKEARAKTERTRNNPLQHMIRLLNKNE